MNNAYAKLALKVESKSSKLAQIYNVQVAMDGLIIYSDE